MTARDLDVVSVRQHRGPPSDRPIAPCVDRGHVDSGRCLAEPAGVLTLPVMRHASNARLAISDHAVDSCAHWQSPLATDEKQRMDQAARRRARSHATRAPGGERFGELAAAVVADQSHWAAGPPADAQRPAMEPHERIGRATEVTDDPGSDRRVPKSSQPAAHQRHGRTVGKKAGYRANSAAIARAGHPTLGTQRTQTVLGANAASRIPRAGWPKLGRAPNVIRQAPP
jgi:hypothetical protein